MVRRRQWGYAGGQANNKPSDEEKREITQACETFIAEVLKPRFLPEIRPTTFNYCVDIFGKWHGNKYRFIQLYRSDDEERRIKPEFEAPFARLEYAGRDRFDLSYFRHTGQWWTVHQGVTLAQAIDLLENHGIFHPH